LPTDAFFYSITHQIPFKTPSKSTNSVKMADQRKGLKSRRLHSTAHKQHLSAQKPEPQSDDNGTGPSQLATSALVDDIHSASPRDPEILPDVPIHGIESGDDIGDTDFGNDDLFPQSDTDSGNEEGEFFRRLRITTLTPALAIVDVDALRAGDIEDATSHTLRSATKMAVSLQ
jgi:hypothetical protein